MFAFLMMIDCKQHRFSSVIVLRSETLLSAQTKEQLQRTPQTLKLFFRLCAQKSLTSQNYYAAEAMLFTIYHHQKTKHDKNLLDLLERKVDTPFAQKVIQLVKKTGTLDISDPMILHDRLRLVLDGITESGFIDQNVKGYFQGMFDPKKGFQDIYLSDIQILRSHPAINESQRLPIQANSTLLPIFMHYLYSISNKTGKLESRPKINIHHIVGTPGMGKSFGFYAIKHIHDLRMPYLLSLDKVSEATGRSGLFEEDYKIFYVYATANQINLRRYFLKQLENDFINTKMGTSFNNKESQVSFQKFVQEINQIYFKKKISTRVIVDQINKIYKQYPSIRKISNQLLFEMVYSFQKPTICVSSQNNPYLQRDVDPILFAAGSTYNNIQHIKTVLENEITPEQRLSLAIECLIFELQKNRHITRSRAIRIISCRQLKIGFLTHMQIAKAVKNTFDSFEDLKDLDDLNNLKEYQKFAEQLQSWLEFQQENSLVLNKFNEFLRNIQDGNKLQKKLEQDWVYSVAQLLSFTMNNAKEEIIKGTVQLYNDEGKLKRVEKNFKCITKVEKKNLLGQKYNVISKRNFFFENIINESTKKREYFLYSEKISNKLRNEYIQKFTLPFLKKIIKNYPQNLAQYFENNTGYFFSNFVIQIYLRKTDQDNGFATIIKYGQKQLKCTVARKSRYTLSFKQNYQQKQKKQTQQNQQIYLKQNQKNQHQQEKQQPQSNCQKEFGWKLQQQWQISEKDKDEKYTFWHDIFRQQGGYFFTLEKGEPCFDFLLSERKGSALTLLLVDTTISGSQKRYNQKFQKFIEFLTPKTVSKLLSFESKRLNIEAQINQLKIFHVVLTAQKIKVEKESDDLEESQITEGKNDKKTERSLIIDQKLSELEPEVRKKVKAVSVHAQFHENFIVEGVVDNCNDILQKIKYVEEMSHWRNHE